MASQTITTDINMDHSSISGLVNGDGLTINNNATLTVNSDTRYCAQAATPARHIVNEGILHFDGRDVWWLAYTDGSGTVPVRNHIDQSPINLVQGAASGEILAVYAQMGATPVAPGSSMPSTGFIKLRTKTGDFTSGAATFSGGTVTLSNAGQRGWLNIVNKNADFVQIGRLATWRVTGDWFELGTTSGNRGDSFTYFVNDFPPAIWVETAPGSDEFEVWTEVGSLRWFYTTNPTISEDIRGRFFCATRTSDIVTIYIAGPAGGYCPPAGCRVRVPNIHLSATSDYSTYISPDTAVSSRWYISAQTGGVLDWDKCNAAGIYLAATSAFQVKWHYVGAFHHMLLSRIVQPLDLKDIGVAIYGTYMVNPAINLNTLRAGGTIEGCKFTKYTMNDGNMGFQALACSDLTFTKTEWFIFGRTFTDPERNNSTQAPFRFQNCSNFVFNQCRNVLAAWLFQDACDGLTLNNCEFADRTIGTTTSTNITNVYRFENSRNITINGFRNYEGLVNVNCGDHLFRFNTCADVVVENIGSPSTPYDMGTTYASSGITLSQNNNNNVSVRRCYIVNSRSETLGFNKTDNKITAINVWGSGSHKAYLISQNAIVKGCFGAYPVNQFSTVEVDAVYGNHFVDGFLNTTEGYLGILSLEKTQEPQSAAAYTIISGDPRFNSASGLYFNSPDDVIEYTWPHPVLGHTGFQNVNPGLNGSNWVASFDIDQGSGFTGSFTSLTGANLAALGALDPDNGFILKLRIGTSSTTTLRGLRLLTTTNGTAQQVQYPLDTVTLTLNGLKLNTEVRVMDSSLNIIGGIENTNSTSFSLEIQPQTVSVAVHALNYQSIRYDNLDVYSDTTLLVQQQVDRQYLNP